MKKLIMLLIALSIRIAHSNVVPVYNIEVYQKHRYFVGEDKVLAHNPYGAKGPSGSTASVPGIDVPNSKPIRGGIGKNLYGKDSPIATKKPTLKNGVWKEARGTLDDSVTDAQLEKSARLNVPVSKLSEAKKVTFNKTTTVKRIPNRYSSEWKTEQRMTEFIGVVKFSKEEQKIRRDLAFGTHPFSLTYLSHK